MILLQINVCIYNIVFAYIFGMLAAELKSLLLHGNLTLTLMVTVLLLTVSGLINISPFKISIV